MRTFLIILISSFLGSCWCDKEHNYYLLTKTKEYFAPLSDGSYLVFTDKVDSTISDTLTLRKYSRKMEFEYTESKCDGDNFETITYELISNDLEDSLRVSMSSGPNIDQYRISGKFRNIEIVCSHTIDVRTHKFEFSAYGKDILEEFQTYQIKNATFSNVVKLTFTQLKYDNHIPKYAHSKNIGLIEFTGFDQLGKVEKTYYLKSYVRK